MRTPKLKCRRPATDNPALWGRLANTARWRDCVTHGKVECPDLSERTHKGGTVHIQATCPECGCYLGNVAQKREPIADASALPGIYRAYREQALAAGHLAASAWHRFKHDYGIEPNPAWIAQKQGGAA